MATRASLAWLLALLALLGAAAAAGAVPAARLPPHFGLAGGDALFWGSFAVDLRDGGAMPPGRPPVFPAAWAVATLLRSVGYADGGVVVARVAGLLLGALAAWAARPAAGGPGAVVAGVAVLLLPDLLGSTQRAEPNTLFAAITLLGLGLAARAGPPRDEAAAEPGARRRLGFPLASGLCLGLATLTKESGLVYAVLVSLGLAVDRGWRAGLAAVVGAAAPVLAWMGYEQAHTGGRFISKLALPVDDMLTWLREGRLPHPLQPLEGGAAGQLGPATPAPPTAAEVLHTQLGRVVDFMGLWFFLLPPALALAAAVAPRARFGRLNFPLFALALPLLVPVQHRHAEGVLLGALPALAVAAGWLLRRSWGAVLLLGALGALGVQGWRQLGAEILPQLRFEAARNAETALDADEIAVRTATLDLPVCALDYAAGLSFGRDSWCEQAPPTPFLLVAPPGQVQRCLDLHPGRVERLVETTRLLALRVDDPAVAAFLVDDDCAPKPERDPDREAPR